jgi:pimeloyl-ACP methyl ester carboxylesterase
MIRDYARLDYDGQIHHTHFRRAGNGPPLILLHPSPMSSAFMTPLIERIQDMATVYAPDTPGYGASDPLPEPGADLSPYVDWLRRFLASRGLSRAGIYGSATGAQIAIEFARKHPQMAQFVVLDNAVHFNDEERSRIVEDYFPDLSPRPDGAHLQSAWEMSGKLYQYFPWFDQREESKVSDVQAPVGLVHATAMAYLVAGPDYDRAYRAAFNNEDANNVLALSQPTRILRWKGSILRKYADRLDDFKWPAHIEMIHCEASPDARYEALTNIIAELLEM